MKVLSQILTIIKLQKTAKVAVSLQLALMAGLFFAPNLALAVTSPATETSVVETSEGETAGATEETSVAEEEHAEEGGHHNFGFIFIALALLLMAAKVGGVIEKFGQPAVLGELLSGIVISAIGFAGVAMIGDIRGNETIAFLAEIGAVILLFQIGLESNVSQLMKVGLNAFIVAVIGVVVPFVLGTFLIGPYFFPDAPSISHLFLGASMVATSVGITASVFKSLGILKSRSAQTVLGAAVIDDVLGLLVLAIVSAIATGGEVSVGFVTKLSVQAFLFLGGAIVLGGFLAKPVSDLFSKINTGTGMKLALAFSIALSFAYAATLVGLAPIIGAFAAGLVLDAVHFESFDAPKVSHLIADLNLKKKKNVKKLNEIVHKIKHSHIEDMVESLALVFVPIFFAFTGLQIEIASLLDPSIYMVAIATSVVAVLGKIAAGIAAKGNMTERLLVGVSMVPRGEVGLIFASIGKSLGAIGDREFSVIIMMVIVTTFIAPPFIKVISAKLAKEL